MSGGQRHFGARLELSLLAGLGILLGAAPPAEAPAPPSVAEAIRSLKPGEFIWAGELVPDGPVLLVINLATQRTLLYRNGVPVAASTISSGAPGRDTPEGLFKVLEKQRVHFSSRYNNAPMPFMQRLSWKGIALHGGQLPGYPASHGCIRLPRAFAEKLYGATSVGTRVLVTSRRELPRILGEQALGISPPVEPVSGLGRLNAPRTLTVVASEADRRLVVLADGQAIGQAPVIIQPKLAETIAFRLQPGGVKWTRWTFSTRPAFEPSSSPWPILVQTAQARERLEAAMAPGSTLILVPDSLAGP